MSTSLIPLADMERMAQAMAKSNLFGVKTPDQALSLMLLSQAQGIHPAQAAVDYHLINGKPALTTNAVLSRFQQAGGKIVYEVYTEKECKATLSHPQGGSLTLSWTIEQAAKAGLTKKDNWVMYPRAMLRSRVVAEGVRAVYPSALNGLYTDSEVADFDVKPPRKPSGQPEQRVEKVVEGEVLPPDAPDAPEAEEPTGPNLDSFLLAMDACEEMECLKQQFQVAKLAFRNDKPALARIAAMKDAVKARIDEAIRKDAEEV